MSVHLAPPRSIQPVNHWPWPDIRIPDSTERERRIERKSDRQAERQTEIKTEIKTDRQKDRNTDREKDSQRERPRERNKERQRQHRISSYWIMLRVKEVYRENETDRQTDDI